MSLKWEYTIAPTALTKQRIGIFKRYAENALLRSQSYFTREFWKRVNPQTGTHIKSKRILRMLQRGESGVVSDATSAQVNMELIGSESEMRMAHTLEYGGKIKSISGKKLKIPKHIRDRKAQASSAGLKHVKLGNKQGLADPAQWKRTYSFYRSEKRKGRTPSNLNWGVKYWLKEEVKVSPKHYFSDTVAATRELVREDFPRAISEAWSRILRA